MLNNYRRVVVTGMGVISPIGLTVSNMWEALISGKSGVNYISHFDPAPFDTKFAAEVKGFNPIEYVNRKEAHRMDRLYPVRCSGKPPGSGSGRVNDR